MLFLGERLSLVELMGGVIVILGVWIVTTHRDQVDVEEGK